MNIVGKRKAPTDVPTPPSGYATLYIRLSDGMPCVKYEDGSTTTLVGVPSTRQLLAGNGLTGGGDLSTDRTLSALAADGSITVGASGIAVGALATDAQHGNRGGAALHAVATASVAGFMPAADKSYINNQRSGWVNLMDYGADPTGVSDCVAAFTAAIAALPAGGGVVFMPPGSYKAASTITVTKAGVKFLGANRNNTQVVTSSTTADVFLVNQWYVCFENFTISTSVNRTAGYAINAPTGYAYCTIQQIDITGGSSSLLHYNGLNISNQLCDVDNVQIRFWSNYGIYLSGASDHRISRVIMDNAAQAVSGVRIELTASLLMANCNIIHAGNALDVSPSGTNTIPSIKAVNCFFDTSTNGVMLNPGTGYIYRSEFTNCWMSSHTGAGILITGANIDGITFENCDIYANANGILVSGTAPAGDWLVTSSRFAGNTVAGINLIAGATHFPQILNCDIGPQAAFGANATGLIIGAGTYKGLMVCSTKVLGNTTNFTMGAVTVATADAANFNIASNAGINPRGAVTTPAVPATTVAAVNTTGFTVQVFLRAGTITAISINGVATGATATPSATGTLVAVLPPGGSIAITYTVAPTMVWIAN